MERSCVNPTHPSKETILAVDEAGVCTATYLDDFFHLTPGPFCTPSIEEDPCKPTEVALNKSNGPRSRIGLPGACGDNDSVGTTKWPGDCTDPAYTCSIKCDEVGNPPEVNSSEGDANAHEATKVSSETE